MTSPAPSPAHGSFEDGFEPVAQTFASQLASGAELGAGFTVYQHGRCVVNLWGGTADLASKKPWNRDTRVVLFSVTKGLAAMALAFLANRGRLEWDAPVARYWPGFARGGKESITVRQLLNHRAGLAVLDERFTLTECCDPAVAPRLLDALERQAPVWNPGEDQGYHAVTYGLYAAEVCQRIAGETMGGFLQRELFEPLGAEVSLGTSSELEPQMATLYAPSALERIRGLAGAPRGNEAKIAQSLLTKNALALRAFANPSLGRRGLVAYDDPAVRRAELAWASATGSAHGIARAYLPFALGGEVNGRRYVAQSTLTPIYDRQSWSERDRVLQKPIGWSEGFLKEGLDLFSPTRESFGHAGIGGALGWCDPVHELSLGYVMNRLDWRVRSPRALALCHALYRCPPIAG